jgi:pyruvate, water dikinase
MTATCAPLSQLRAGDEPEYGGKSAALGELLSAGIPVPPGFALSRHAQRPDGVDAALREELGAQLAELARVAGTDDPPVAVRSSAVGEDSAEATFAGQQETILWVRGLDEVCAAVESCWESLYSVTAVTYRERMGDGREPAMGVTIQLMVDARSAGVMFTCNPVSGDPSTIAINASWGLGLAVVGGEVTPDDILLSRVTGEILRETIGDKRIEYVPDPGGPGVRTREIEDARAGVRCLARDELDALLDLARRVHAHFGSHQDVEWAIARTGSPPDNVYLVQSRPVTTLAPRPRTPPPASAIAMVMAQFGAGPGAAGR